MNRTVATLLLLLAVQSLVVASLYHSPDDAALQEAGEVFAPFAVADVDALQIGDEYDNEAALIKRDGRWLLPALEDLPADAGRVDKLLRAITTGDGDWHVASSVAARQRFQVADYYYQRRITLLHGERELGTYYLGTAPDFRRVHARNHNQDAIYSIPFSNFDAPALDGKWLSPGLLQLRAPVAIVADGYDLSFDGGTWRSGSGGAPDERELDALLDTLATIQVDGAAAEDQQRDLAQADADLTMAVRTLAGEVTLELFTLGERHYIHSSRYPPFFSLSAYDYDRLTGIDFGLISGTGSK